MLICGRKRKVAITTLQQSDKLLATMTPAEKIGILHRLVKDIDNAFPRIESHPDVCGGASCIVRTRMSVRFLARARLINTSSDDTLRCCPSLRAEDLAARWAYFGTHREKDFATPPGGMGRRPKCSIIVEWILNPLIGSPGWFAHHIRRKTALPTAINEIGA